MKVPLRYFRDDSQYKVRLNISNADITFNSFVDFTFVPICQYYVVNSYTAQSYFLNYTQPSNTEDIKFRLDMLTTSTNCMNYGFYNQIIKKANY